MNRFRTFRDGPWLAGAVLCFLIGGFIILTSEVRESLAGEKELIGTIDQFLLAFMVEHRIPSLNGMAIDLTALGSGAVLAILTLFLCLFFLLGQRWHLAAHAVLAAAGAGALTAALKFYFERSRPNAALRLVDVQGFSYPSGHSLASAAIYFTCAILVAKQFPGLASRSIVCSFFLALIAVVGLTRIYLGVHFFSDVMAGVMIGIAWACLLEIVVSHLGPRLAWKTRT